MTARHDALTARLAARYGGSATLTRATGADESVYPPTPGTAADYTVVLIETGAETESRNGTLVETGDLVAAMQPHPEISPQVGDKITAGGAQFSVLRVEAVRGDPAGAVICWRVEGRR